MKRLWNDFLDRCALRWSNPPWWKQSRNEKINVWCWRWLYAHVPALLCLFAAVDFLVVRSVVRFLEGAF